MGERYDFCGYATKNDLLCTDGLTIRKDAFKNCDGVTVPLVWNHRHDDPDMVIGHALLQNRPDGVFMYGKFNDTEKGNTCKKILENKDITGLSIWANQLKKKSGDVLHGVIREVSLVLAGANPGALIDFSLAHSAEGADDDEVYIYLNGEDLSELKHGDIEFEAAEDTAEEAEEKEEEEPVMAKTTEYDELSHADEAEEKEEKKPAEKKPETNDEKKSEDEETVEEILDTLNEKQKIAVNALLAAVMEDDDEEEDDDDEKGEKNMKHNVFENEHEENVLSHADIEQIFSDAKRLGSLRDAVNEHAKDGVLAHSVTGPDDYGIYRGQAPVSGAKYGVYDPSMLFPEFKSIDATPEWIRRDTAWADEFIASVKHTPFSRIKTVAADITADDARALGYIKGNMKKEEFFTLIKRTTDPQTIYKKQKMDRDDIIDITDFDVVAWIRAEMRVMLNEEIARAALIGDGRSGSSPDKISESHVRPIATDADLFSVKVSVTAGTTDEDTAKNFIKAAIRARKNYKGSGNPVLYIKEDMLSEILLIEDGIGHLLYQNETALMTTLRVRKIVPVPVMENVTIPITVSGTTTNHELYGIIVNPIDYVIGADKGGAINMFDDFDINYNQEKYLIETRISGALVKPYSALVMYAAAASNASNGTTEG